jgi:hypothetical protein
MSITNKALKMHTQFLEPICTNGQPDLREAQHTFWQKWAYNLISEFFQDYTKNPKTCVFASDIVLFSIVKLWGPGVRMAIL